MHLKKPQSAGFSLVELLVVMGIISILASLSVLAMKAGFTGLTSAGDQVSGVFAFARQEAISKNTLTAVVLVTSNSAGDAAYRTFAVFELTLPTYGSAPTSSDWNQASKWWTLPTGMVVDDSSGVSTFLATTTITPALPNLDCHGIRLDPATDCAVQVFMPSGILYPPATDPCTLQLVEGFYPAASSTISYQHKNASSHPLNYVSYIFSTATGEPKVVRP